MENKIPEFKPTSNKVICDKASECTMDCHDKDIHHLIGYCLQPCDRQGGISGAVCVPIPLTGAELIADERRRQIEVEGWTAEHDAGHAPFSMAIAGACYALDLKASIVLCTDHRHENFIVNDALDCLWPWDMEWWKPTPNDPIRQLVKAGALIAAEIDRLQRKA